MVFFFSCLFKRKVSDKFLRKEGDILFSLLTRNVNDLVETVKAMPIEILRNFLYLQKNKQ